jgi:hypothetical protein
MGENQGNEREREGRGKNKREEWASPSLGV